MRLFTMALLSVFVGPAALASVPATKTYKNPADIYKLLTEAKGLQEQVARAGMSYSFPAVVDSIEVSFNENTDDPDYTVCEVTFKANVKHMMGMSAPEIPETKVSDDYGQACEYVDYGLGGPQ
ncbi:MAG: hypothetical protein HRT45_16995 [Bdellovibrionales bacterium]|nr:hypothetical protein [Bdellovibrionales bacterium]